MKLKVTVTDSYRNKMYCKIIVEKITEESSEQIYVEAGRVYCDGIYEFELEEGRYRLEAFRGKLYKPFIQVVEIKDKDMDIEAPLEEMVDTKALKLYSFDAHSHVSRDEVLDTGNLVSASTIMKGEDFNFFFAGSPYDHEVHLQYLNHNFTDKVSYREKFKDTIKQVSNESYILDIGNEIVKGRFGHAFMMNYIQTVPFSKYYDEEWDPWLFTKVGEEPPYSIPCMHEALLRERGENSVAALAHPTSWWYHDNGEFITNIAATAGFEILAGSIDAMVVMGYQSDRKHYQELWFDALNNGYFLPGIAETDAAFDHPPKRFLQFKTYAIADEFSIDSICRAVREGRCIVSSGPIALMKVNGQQIGAVLNYSKGQSFQIEIDAYRCFEGKLSKIQIIVNGDVVKELDLCEDTIKVIESVKIEKDSFVLVKCYDSAGNLCMTNPVYIRNTPFVNKGYMSKVSLNVLKNGEAVKGTCWIDDGDEKVSFSGSAEIEMKPSSKLYVEAEGQVKTIKLFELPELQEIFKNLYFGYFNKDKAYEAGEVPASEFKLSEIRRILDHVKINLQF